MNIVNPNRKIYVYRNLRNNCLSLMQQGRIVGHAQAVILTDVEFRVREAGRQRVLREKQKNVHAFTIGSLELCATSYGASPLRSDEQDKDGNLILSTHDSWLTTHSSQLSYNPYKFPYFYDKATEAPVYSGKRVLVTATNGIYVED